MTLLNAPEYDSRRETRNRNLLISAGVLVVLSVVIGVGGFLLGHGWFFSNLPVEHRIDKFLSTLEEKEVPDNKSSVSAIRAATANASSSSFDQNV